MGCDIHIYSERLDPETNQWTLNEPYYRVYPDEAKTVPLGLQFYRGRDYALFGVIAGVGSPGLWNQALCPQRGIPEDASDPVKEMYADWGCDAHSASYLTCEELQTLYSHYEGKSYVVSGVMPADKLERLNLAIAEARRVGGTVNWGHLLYPYAERSTFPDWSPFSVAVPFKDHGPILKIWQWIDKLKWCECPTRVVFWFDN